MSGRSDLYNRQLHADKDPNKDEKTLAKKLADESGDKYTEQQIEDQMVLMNLTADGKTSYGGNQVASGASRKMGVTGPMTVRIRTDKRFGRRAWRPEILICRSTLRAMHRGAG